MRYCIIAVMLIILNVGISFVRHQPHLDAKVDQVTGSSNCVEKPGLPISLGKKLEQIFRELSTPELLVRCLHRNTHNSNEA